MQSAPPAPATPMEMETDRKFSYCCTVGDLPKFPTHTCTRRDEYEPKEHPTYGRHLKGSHTPSHQGRIVSQQKKIRDARLCKGFQCILLCFVSPPAAWGAVQQRST